MKRESLENTMKQTLEILFLYFCQLYINKVGEKYFDSRMPQRLFWPSDLYQHAMTSMV